MTRVPLWLLAPLVACATAPPRPPRVVEAAMPAPVVPVRVVRAEGAWRLVRGETPYAVRGVGYKGNLDALVAAGGNAIRTWGVDESTRALLDEAWAKGVTVTLGIWLGHIEHGFDYGDDTAVAEQLLRAEREVERFKDHPALLMWGVGNEVELEGGDDPRIWAAIEKVAAMIHRVDPNHPTMIVTADIGTQHDRRVKEDCPSIDVWGINAYGGAASLPDRLDARGWNGPIALTEYGGFGDWERPKHPWGVPQEQTSTEKAATYAATYRALHPDARTIGTFAFIWGPADLPTDNWFALFGPGGVRYEATDTLALLWGKPPEDRAPSVQAGLTGLDGSVVEPGATITATLSAVDPEGAPITYDWVLHHDEISGSGAGTPVSCLRNGGQTFSGPVPMTEGAYRLLGVARDPAGGAAFASARFHVGPSRPAAGPSLPLWVDGAFDPSGWMGDASDGGVTMSDCAPPNGICSGRCRRFEVKRGAKGWSGVVWHHPTNNWKGMKAGVMIPPEARTVFVTAWGESGGEAVTFGVGNRDADGFETAEHFRLTTTPTVYRLNIAGFEWRDIAYGFSWVASPADGEVLRFNVADITWSEQP